MKTRLQRIEIRNFKAFRSFGFYFDSKHLLVYGGNGSGKSSLYWALHCFLESSRKSVAELGVYFDPNDPRNLLNIKEPDYGAHPGEISVTLRNMLTNVETTYPISLSDHSTQNVEIVSKGSLGSDFITYRFFFGFSHFRGSSTFNLWDLFEAEILPFCVSSSGSPEAMWRNLKASTPNPGHELGKAGAQAYAHYANRVQQFNAVLDRILGETRDAAQRFYERHFHQHGEEHIEIDLALTPAASRDTGHQWRLVQPLINLRIRTQGKTIDRPQVHLNEAKLTQLALSVRLGAAQTNLNQSDLKLLVLDDLLVSLDMSNRMKVIDLLLSEEFRDYQKLIFTHDRGLYQETRRQIGATHPEWRFCKMRDMELVEDKRDLELAEHYLRNDQLSECGNRLRQHAEDVLDHFLRRARANGLAQVVDQDEFESLASKIRQARNLLAPSASVRIEQLLQGGLTDQQWTEILSEAGVDPANVTAANDHLRGQLIAKLIASRRDLYGLICDTLTESARAKRTADQLLADVDRIRNRILNPASHAGEAPLFTGEAQAAITIIGQLETALQNALAVMIQA